MVLRIVCSSTANRQRNRPLPKSNNVLDANETQGAPVAIQGRSLSDCSEASQNQTGLRRLRDGKRRALFAVTNL
jgi:hypothetical protein